MIWIGGKIPVWIERLENFRMMELDAYFTSMLNFG
jgi:hypothetical protein